MKRFKIFLQLMVLLTGAGFIVWELMPATEREMKEETIAFVPEWFGLDVRVIEMNEAGLPKREFHADIAADGPHPDRFSIVTYRGIPETEMQALVDIVPRLLECDVLRIIAIVKRADRGVAVIFSGEEGLSYRKHGT